MKKNFVIEQRVNPTNDWKKYKQFGALDTAQLMGLGLKFNPAYESFVGRTANTSDVNVHWTEITLSDDVEWDILLSNITKVLKDRQQNDKN